MLAAIALLLAVGVAFVFSAGFRGENAPVAGLYKKQLLWAGFGLVLFFIFALTDYSRLLVNAWFLYVSGLILLALLFVPGLGFRIYGATRWLGFGSVRLIQPAELMKIALVLFIARILGRPGIDLTQQRYLFACLGLVAVPVILIMLQPDLGTALVLLPVVFAMMFCSGMKLKPLIIIMLAGLAFLALVAALVLVPEYLEWDDAAKEKMIRPLGLRMYHRERIMVFFDSETDPLGTGWSKRQSQLAVGSGQLWGKGYLQGTQNVLGFLPKTVAPTDFIFSVIAEEKGFAGAAVVLALFTLVIVRGMNTAARIDDKSARLMCVGLSTLVFCHVFINTGMAIGLLPTTGLPLPLISYGGTFIVGVMSMLGIIQSVHVRSPKA